jgi:hypothetical protein
MAENGLPQLPLWDDEDDVVALFDDEELNEWCAHWPYIVDDPDAPSLIDAYGKRKRSRLHGKKRRRGRPYGKMSKAKRIAMYPIHRAASMMPAAEGILMDLYPGRKRYEVRTRAALVVRRMWHRHDGQRIWTDTLVRYVTRAKKDRHRI